MWVHAYTSLPNGLTSWWPPTRKALHQETRVPSHGAIQGWPQSFEFSYVELDMKYHDEFSCIDLDVGDFDDFSCVGTWSSQWNKSNVQYWSLEGNHINKNWRCGLEWNLIFILKIEFASPICGEKRKYTNSIAVPLSKHKMKKWETSGLLKSQAYMKEHL